MYSIGNETSEQVEHDVTGTIKRFDTPRPTTGGMVFEGVDVDSHVDSTGRLNVLFDAKQSAAPAAIVPKGSSRGAQITNTRAAIGTASLTLAKLDKSFRDLQLMLMLLKASVTSTTLTGRLRLCTRSEHKPMGR
jgi:hypothetical protein